MADLTTAQSVLYHRPKARADESEWEDCGGYATLPDGTARAVVGDGALFHVRAGRVVGQLPALAAEDFGINPDGVFTQPETRARMRAAMTTGTGRLQPGDLLFLATDALAAWLAGRSATDGGQCLR